MNEQIKKDRELMEEFNEDFCMNIWQQIYPSTGCANAKSYIYNILEAQSRIERVRAAEIIKDSMADLACTGDRDALIKLILSYN